MPPSRKPPRDAPPPASPPAPPPMPRVDPHIRCVDVWPRVSRDKIAAYRALEQRGAIRILAVRYSRKTGQAVLTYDSIAPHAWTLDALKKLYLQATKGDKQP